MYSYFANGLFISSEIFFPELFQLAGQPDVVIRRGSVPDKLQNAEYSSQYSQISDSTLLLTIPQVAKFLVTNDNNIVIDANAGGGEDALRAYILSSILGFILHKKSVLPIHAAAINRNSKVLLFSGASGIGKSTLSLGFYKKGYEVLTDDISGVYFERDGRPFMYPGYNNLKLLPETLASYGYSDHSFRKIESVKGKFSYPIAPLENSCRSLDAIFFIRVDEVSQFSFRKIEGVVSFNLLRVNTFRYLYVKHLGKQSEHFKMVSDVINHVQCYELIRPKHMAPQVFVNNIEEVLSSLEL